MLALLRGDRVLQAAIMADAGGRAALGVHLGLQGVVERGAARDFAEHTW